MKSNQRSVTPTDAKRFLLYQKGSAAKNVKKKKNKKKNKRPEKADGNDETINRTVSSLDVSDLHKLTSLRISMT